MDVVIPVIEKDLDVLPLCLEGIYHCVSHKIGKIYVIGPRVENIVRFAETHGLQFVDEVSVLGYSPKDLSVIVDNRNRSGWIFQQLVKLSGRVGSSPYFLVIDSDHVLVRPHTFISNDVRHVFYMSKEYHYPYYANVKKLFGHFPFHRLSYISHKMVFDRDKLADLRQEIESKNPGRGSWDQVILLYTDKQTISFFSEYETYGHSIPSSDKLCLPWKQKHLRKNTSLPTYDYLCKRYSSSYWSITFPDYLKLHSVQ